MNGPEAEVKSAFAVFGRTPAFIGPTTSTTDAGPGGMAVPFFGAEQRVRRSDIQRALTEQPPRPWFIMASLRVLLGTVGGQGAAETDVLRGFGAGGAFLHRLGMSGMSLGAYVGVAKLSADEGATNATQDVVGLDTLAVLQFTHKTGWLNLGLGLHADWLSSSTLMSAQRIAPMYAIQAGWKLFDVGTHRMSVGVHWETELASDNDYAAVSASLWYTH
jgi:hypothetical protein